MSQYTQLKVLRIVEKDWTDKKTGEAKPMWFLEGTISENTSFSIMDAPVYERYKNLVGREILVPYTERPRLDNKGVYKAVDPLALPVPAPSAVPANNNTSAPPLR